MYDFQSVVHRVVKILQTVGGEKHLLHSCVYDVTEHSVRYLYGSGMDRRRRVSGSGYELVVRQRSNSARGEQLMRRASQNVLEVAHKPVDIASSGRLVYDVLVVVVAQASAQFLVVHLRLLLARAPATRDLVWVAETEFPSVAGPRDDVLTVGIGQLLQ